MTAMTATVRQNGVLHRDVTRNVTRGTSAVFVKSKPKFKLEMKIFDDRYKKQSN